MDTAEADRAALAERIRIVVEAFDTKRAAAHIAGVTTQQLHNLTTGKNAPSLLPVARLAAAAGYDLNWVVTGLGQPKLADKAAERAGELNPRLFGRLFDALSKVYRELGVKMPEGELGQLAAEEYKDVAAAAAETEDEQIAMVRLVAARHRRRIEQENLKARKRGA